jgi:hypothetical protein
MKAFLRTFAVFGLALLFLINHQQAKASPQCGTCEAWTCIYYGDIQCDNDQYMYAAPSPGECNSGECPSGCQCNPGDVWVNPQYATTNCYDAGGGDCVCPFDSDPTEWTSGGCS